MNSELIGLVAGFLTTFAFIPQVVKIWRSRSARDISLPMYLAFTTGVALWLCYGLLTESLPVIVANVVTLALALAVIAMKLRFDRR